MARNALYEQRAVREKQCPRFSCQARTGQPCMRPRPGSAPRARLLHPHKERYDLVIADIRDQGGNGWNPYSAQGWL